MKDGFPLRNILLPGDHFVLDRGFRDSQGLLKSLNYVSHMPSLLHGETRFNTEDANNSRIVTMVRWLVEAVNGRIKNKFKFFEQTVDAGTVHILLFYLS